MKRVFLFLILAFMATIASAQINEIERSTPEEQGVPSKALIALFDSLHLMPQTDIHSMIVMRHGKIVGEFYPAPFAPEYQHTQYSSSKTLVSMAVGLAVDENRLRLTDRVAAFFPEYLPDTVSARLASMTVRDLLTMTSGIKPDWAMRSKGREWIRTFLGKPVVNKPGEVFAYDSMVTYMLSAIVQKVTGMKVLDYLKLRLFNPMNISVVNWEESPEGVNTGGWGLHIQSESLAKVGQMWLDGGVWNGEQLISRRWITQMSTRQTNGGDYGYGLQTWMCAYPSAVRADGALGQYVIVVPEKDVVIVLTEASFTNGKPQRGLIWNKFLPELSDEPLPASDDYKKLLQKQASYQLPVAAGKSKSSVFKKLSGKRLVLPKNKYGWQEIVFNEFVAPADMQFGVQSSEGNELLGRKSVSVKRGEAVLNMTITKNDGTSYTQPLGAGKWLTDTIAGFPPYSINPIDWHKGLEGPFYGAGSYGWEKNNLNATLHYVNWVTSLDLKFEILDGKVLLHISNNYTKNKVEKFECDILD